MRSNRIVPFKISGMDSLGQGVSKEGDKITFVPKAMIGDEGEAMITGEKKGVAFAKITQLSKSSELRIEPQCQHFAECPSCHYLHTSYEQEIKFKEENLERMFRKLNPPKIKVVPALRRFHYRNRVQLHYDLRKKSLGMLDARSGNIAPIPQCLIGLEPITKEIQRLYQNQNWLNEAPQSTPQGHVEIYFHNNECKTTWNKPYADGGFTQVFEEMNQLLKNELLLWAKKKNLTTLLDLFAGNGNLSNEMKFSQRLAVDIYPQGAKEGFYSQDLYDKNAQRNVLQKLKSLKISPDYLLLDPPRSGMKDLSLWVDELKPKSIAYVSCDPHTLVRDVASLDDYRIDELHLYDFFPSTFHFETMIFLERN